MILHKDHLCTVIPIWSPRYSDKYGTEGEWVVLISKYKMQYASPVVKVEFTKAKHLKGQRFCITRQEVERCPVTTNGKIECYAVNMSKLQSWETAAEVRDLALGVFDD